MEDRYLGASNLLKTATPLVQVVQGFALFAEVSSTDRAAIVASAHEKHFARRETIFAEGDPVRHVLLLLSGCVKVTQIGINGGEVILRLNGPGDIVGAFGQCANCDHCSTAQTIQPSTALVWDVAHFESILEHFPAFRRYTVRALEQRLGEMEQRFREVSTEKVGSRLSSALLRLSNQAGQSGNRVEIALSRAELAQMTGTTLFTVSRLLCQWKLLGIVSPRREAVVVQDVAALRELAESE
jgi:CRP/FNR family transcriptional regulator, nitrogen oxide reductase regulator